MTPQKHHGDEQRSRSTPEETAQAVADQAEALLQAATLEAQANMNAAQVEADATTQAAQVEAEATEQAAETAAAAQIEASQAIVASITALDATLKDKIAQDGVVRFTHLLWISTGNFLLGLKNDGTVWKATNPQADPLVWTNVTT